MPSLQRRLLLGTTAGMAVVLLISGIVLFAMTRSSLLKEFDRALCEKVVTLSTMIEQFDQEIVLEFMEIERGEFQSGERPEYFQVWRADGIVVARSPSLRDSDLPRTSDVVAVPTIQVVDLPHGAPGRMATVNFLPILDDEGPPDTKAELLTFAVARDVHDVEAVLARLRLFLVIVGALAMIASAGIFTWIVRVGLRPVEHLARKITWIDEERLSARIDPSESPRELSPIVVRLNELLSRLDAAFARERTMTANVAHELRTPLAGIRSTLEVALSRDRESAAYRQAMSDCLTVCMQTETLVGNLLALARLEAGTELIRREPVDVEALLLAAWKPFCGLADDRGLNMQWNVPAGLCTETDADKLRIVFTNILENAAHYVDTHGAIVISGMRLNGRMQICISNTGSCLTTDEITHVFDRFWRGDSARATTGSHCGLGLSLCKTIVERLGGTIHAETTGDGVFMITIMV